MLTRKLISPTLILAAATLGTLLLSSNRARSNAPCQGLGETSVPTVLASSQKARPNPPAPSLPQTGETKVVAYYFHTTARCTTCLAIESYSREVVEQKFGADIAKGRLEYRLVNVQLPENQHFIKDYQLFTAL